MEESELVRGTKGTSWSPDVSRARDVYIRIDLQARPEVKEGAHVPEIDNPIISRRMRLSRDVFGHVGFFSLNSWDAGPSACQSGTL